MEQSLEKRYGLPTAIAMVVGIVIGSGIFFKAEKILLATQGNMQIGILSWLIGGLIAVVCACAFAVLATRYEKVGGVLDYAEATVGSAYGYYLGWFMSCVYYPALTSCLAWVSARYTCVLLGWDIMGGECMTLTMVYLIGIYFINAVAPRLAGTLQVSLTVIKLIPILLMAVLGTISGLNSGLLMENFSVVGLESSGGHPLFTAVAATAFAYEGWIVATSINAELRDAKRNLPLALVLGVGGVGVIYLLYYVGIAGAVPNAIMMESGEEGAKLAYQNLFGPVAASGLFVFVILSCLGTCNGLMMGCARGFYAIAQRGRGPAPHMMVQVDAYTNMPNNAAALGLVLAALWGFYFFFGTMTQQLGIFTFDSSEVPIITLYGMYIPIFACFMKNCTEETTFRRFVLPGLGVIGSLFFVIAAFFSYGLRTVLCYLCVYLFIMLVGFYFRNGDPKKKDERRN